MMMRGALKSCGASTPAPLHRLRCGFWERDHSGVRQEPDLRHCDGETEAGGRSPAVSDDQRGVQLRARDPRGQGGRGELTGGGSGEGVSA